MSSSARCSRGFRERGVKGVAPPKSPRRRTPGRAVGEQG
jgi:hypothetical protein